MRPSRRSPLWRQGFVLASAHNAPDARVLEAMACGCGATGATMVAGLGVARTCLVPLTRVADPWRVGTWQLVCVCGYKVVRSPTLVPPCVIRGPSTRLTGTYGILSMDMPRPTRPGVRPAFNHRHVHINSISTSRLPMVPCKDCVITREDTYRMFRLVPTCLDASHDTGTDCPLL